MNIKLPDNTQTNSVYFTGNKQETFIYCENNSYIILTATLRIYPFKNTTPKILTLEHKFMSFRGEASVFLGTLFEPYFHIPGKLKEIYDFSGFDNAFTLIELYKPMEVDLLFEEYNYTTNQKLSDQTFLNQKFVRGRSDVSIFPLKKTVSKGRTYPISVMSYSYFVNETTLFYISTRNSSSGLGHVINPYMVTTLIVGPTATISQSGFPFLLRNETKDKVYDTRIAFSYNTLQSVYILWLDENLALNIFKFTGRFKDKHTHELITNTSVSSGKEITRTIEDLKGRNFTVNTGHILKDDTEKINSLISGLKAWITFDTFKTFTSFYINTKDLEYDSEQNLFNFDLDISLNYEDMEDHHTQEPEPDYDLIFTYEVDSDNLTVDLSSSFDYPVQSVNWGDNSENSDLTHTYSGPGSYTIQIKISLLSMLDFQYKNVTSVIKMPSSVVKINCFKCRMDLPGLKNLFKMINSVSQSNGEVVFTDTNYSFFSKYVIVSTQQNPVLLDEETILEAQKLIKKYWFIDYTYNRIFGDIVPTSRYLKSNTYTMYYPWQHRLLLTGAKTYFFNDEDISFTMSVYKGQGVPWAQFDWACFVYPRVDIKENGNWKVKKMEEFPVNTDANILFNLGLLNEGTHIIRGVQQSYPLSISTGIHYDRLKTATVEFDVITRDSVYVKKDTNNEWGHNEFDINVPNSFLNFYPFGFISYSGTGTKLGYYPTSLFSSVLSYAELKEKTVFITEKTGSFLFSFKNYTIDLSGIMASLSTAVFYVAYVTPANKIEISNPVYMDANGKIILNRDFTVNDIPAGSYICPFVNTGIKPGVTRLTGKWDIVNFSRIIIKEI